MIEEILLVVITVTHLSFATYFDIKERLIPDKIWISQIILSILLLMIMGASGKLDFVTSILIVINISFGIIFGFLAFFLGIWGGGDTKAVWAISFSTPMIFSFQHIPLVFQYWPTIFIIIPNMIYGLLFFVIFFLINNLRIKQIQGSLFREDSNFSFLQKVSLLFTGSLLTPQEYLNTKFFDPVEKYNEETNKWEPSLQIFSEILSDEEYEMIEVENRELAYKFGLQTNRKYIWGRFQIPGLVNITFGYIIWLIFGSPIFWLMA